MFKTTLLALSATGAMLLGTQLYAQTFPLTQTDLAVAPALGPAPIYDPNLVKGGNRWRAYAYDDAAADHPQLTWGASNDPYNVYCFYAAGTDGSHQQYRYRSETFSSLRGQAIQEGDKIVMKADFQSGSAEGHESMHWELLAGTPVTEKLATGGGGEYVVWFQSAGFAIPTVFANVVMVRDGYCRRSFSDKPREDVRIAPMESLNIPVEIEP